VELARLSNGVFILQLRSDYFVLKGKNSCNILVSKNYLADLAINDSTAVVFLN